MKERCVENNEPVQMNNKQLFVVSSFEHASTLFVLVEIYIVREQVVESIVEILAKSSGLVYVG
jgi:hypothetical protein